MRHSRSPAFYGTSSAEKLFGSTTSKWTRSSTTSTFNFPTTISSFSERHSSGSWKIHKLKDNEFQPHNNASETSSITARIFTSSSTPVIDLDPISPLLHANNTDHHQELTSFNKISTDGRTSDSNGVLTSTSVQDWKKLKRKASDCNLDLDLSLRVTSRSVIGDQKAKSLREADDDVDSNLSLSLFSPTSQKLSRLKQMEEAAEECRKQQAKRASTLDLTI